MRRPEKVFKVMGGFLKAAKSSMTKVSV